MSNDLHKGITILALETSCDETSASVYTSTQRIVSNIIHSQAKLHAAYGGVVPEIASRAHIEKVGLITQQALEAANITMEDIDAVGVTCRPGLPGALLVGIAYAKSLAYMAQKPIIGVNHIHGHVCSPFIEHDVPFPHLCLLASGGHTGLYYVEDVETYTLIAQTRDDAAGEAIDKCAKMLNLPYPGGPYIEALARKGGFRDTLRFPRLKKDMTDFSFSGLKTAILYYLIDSGVRNPETADSGMVAPWMQEACSSSLLHSIADIFIRRIELALEKYPKAKALTFVGGVAANMFLRERLSEFLKTRDMNLYVPTKRLCTDNAGMIAYVAHYYAEKGCYSDWHVDSWTPELVRPGKTLYDISFATSYNN